MKTSAKVAAGAAAVAAATALLLLRKPSVRAPAGWWGDAVVCLPCSTVLPYKPAVCPSTGNVGYLRYDASITTALPWTGPDEARSAGQGGAQHTVQYILQIQDGYGYGWMIPLAAQLQGGAWRPAPAPYRNVPVKDRPGKTLCDYYENYGGTGCPSGVSLEVYSNQMRGFSEWIGGWPGTKRNLYDPQCSGVQPTAPPPPTGAPGTATRTPTRSKTPTAGPCLPGQPCPVTATKTRTATKTATPSRTPTPAPTCAPPKPCPTCPRPAPVTVVRPTVKP